MKIFNTNYNIGKAKYVINTHDGVKKHNDGSMFFDIHIFKNKKDFLKYASTLAFPIMIQNLISTLVNIADTVMLGYVSQTAMSAYSTANQYNFIVFCYY